MPSQALLVRQGKTEPDAPAVEAIQTLLAQLGASDRNAFVTISNPSALVAEIEMPRFSTEELRSVFRLNSARYLRRDLAGFYFDAVELGDTSADGKARRSPTMQTLVAGVPKEEVLWYRTALNAAKIKADTIELSAVTVINALQRSHAALCEQNVVLLLDIGHQMTSLNLLRRGQPLLTRLVPFGGMHITELLARACGLQPAAAEQQKRSLNEETITVAQGALQTLAREVRSSIDFIERQQDCEICHAFAGGGTACSRPLVEALSQEVGLPIQCWNPLEGFDTTSVDPAALAALAPSLGAAVGVAVAKL